MKTYISATLVKAKPMNRGEYDNYRGWDIPENENPADEGYFIKYNDGYETWLAKKQFEEMYKECTFLSFSEALVLLRRGFKVARKGWNGKKQYIQLATCISYKSTDGIIINCDHDTIGNASIAFVGTSGVQIGWLASQADMLSDDWVIVI